MAKRSLGNNFITKKRDVEEDDIEELMISDEEDREVVVDKEQVKVKEGSCSRTSGTFSWTF